MAAGCASDHCCKRDRSGCHHSIDSVVADADSGSDTGTDSGDLMPQTSVIAAALVIAFFVFITVRGELPKYAGVIGIG
jgi:hypothetical protein